MDLYLTHEEMGQYFPEVAEAFDKSFREAGSHYSCSIISVSCCQSIKGDDLFERIEKMQDGKQEEDSFDPSSYGFDCIKASFGKTKRKRTIQNLSDDQREFLISKIKYRWDEARLKEEKEAERFASLSDEERQAETEALFRKLSKDPGFMAFRVNKRKN